MQKASDIIFNHRYFPSTYADPKKDNEITDFLFGIVKAVIGDDNFRSKPMSMLYGDLNDCLFNLIDLAFKDTKDKKKLREILDSYYKE